MSPRDAHAPGSSAGGQGQAIVGCVGTPGSSRSCHGSCRVPRNPASCPGQVSGPSTKRSRQRHATRNTIPPPPDDVDDRRIAREIIARRNPIEVGRTARSRCLARQHPMHGRQVIALGMGHRTNNRQFVRVHRQLRQVLANPHPGDCCVNRFELARGSPPAPRASYRMNRAAPIRRSAGSR